MARGVDEVEQVRLAVLRRVAHRDRMRLDRDAPFALEVHRIEELVVEDPRVDRLRELHDAVGERGLAVVDVGDDAEISDLGQHV